GVREQNPVTALHQAEQQLLEVLGQRPVRRLDEEIAAALVERGEEQLVVAGRCRPEQVHLGGRDYTYAEVVHQSLVHGGDAAREVVQMHTWVVGPQMGGGRQRGGAVIGRDAQEGEALLDVGSTVVDARQDV